MILIHLIQADWLAKTTTNEYTKGGALHVCTTGFVYPPNSCIDVSPIHNSAGYDTYHIPEQQIPNFNEDYIFFHAVSGEQIGLSSFCPFKIGPATSTTTARSMITDGIPLKKWELKYWGSTTIVFTDLNLWLGAPVGVSTITYQVSWTVISCMTAFGFTLETCGSSQIYTKDVIVLPGQKTKMYIGLFGGVEFFAGVTTMIAGVQIKNKSSEYGFLSSIEIGPTITGNHCFVRNNYGGSFALVGNGSIYFPCTAPLLTMAFSPLPGGPISALTAFTALMVSIDSASQAIADPTC